MQDDVHDELDAVPEGHSRLRRLKAVLSTAVGAVAAVALLAGLGTWLYRVAARDGENVPIIRAAIEPAKERPTDPGGAITPYRDIRSYEVVEGQAQATAVAFAPDRAEPLIQDVAMGKLTPAPQARSGEPERRVAAVASDPDGIPVPRSDAEPPSPPERRVAAIASESDSPSEPVAAVPA